MVGSYRVLVQDKNLRYEFVIRRNITVIQGDSGKGKTTLINAVERHANNRENDDGVVKNKNIVHIECDVECVGFTNLTSKKWRSELSKYEQSIIFLDGDGCTFIASKDFADFVKSSDNYYVLATRDNLKCLAYSPQEVYELVCVKKHIGTKEVFESHFNRLYRSYNVLYPRG